MIALILGRRSGTSSMAQGLYERGFNLPGPLNTASVKSQPNGHYECLPVQEINGKILSYFKLADNFPGLTPYLRLEEVEQWVNEHPEAHVLKDPRLSMTWPIWFRTCSALERPIVAIWCSRYWEEVADSFMRNTRTDTMMNARYAATMYETCIEQACSVMDSIRVDLYDPQRVEKVADWLMEKGLIPRLELVNTEVETRMLEAQAEQAEQPERVEATD